MAPPRKRASSGTPEDDDDERNGNHAESSLSPAKRVKLERLNGNRRTPESDERELDFRAGAGDEDEDGSDDDMEDDEEEDEDEQEVDPEDSEDEDAQLREYAARRAVELAKGNLGVASESGALKRIVLVDFMCHRHLKVDFAPRMNFLVGHNGSGKSAILTAFAVVMGGKTSLTGRGSGLKALIRNGADKAIITATITNKGWEAFKPDVYGDQIIIERVITKTGGTLKIRGSLAGNKVISTKKDELMQMLSGFQLSIDSPLTILTQDKAKVFLAQADEVQLYRFFMEGTGLASLSQEYDRANVTWLEVDRHVQKMRQGIPALKDRLKSVTDKIATASRIEQQKEKAIRIKQELGWAYVQLKESHLHEATKKAIDSKGKLEVTITNLEKSEEDKRKLDEDFNTVNNEVEEMKNAEKPLAQDRKAKALALRAGLKEKDEMQDQLNDLRARMDDHDRTVADLNRKIDAKKREMGDGGMTAQQRADEARLIELESQRNKLQPQVGLKEQVIRDKEAQVNELEAKIEEANGRCMESNREARDLEGGLERMQRQTDNRLSVFGSNIETVMRAIDRAQWHVRPVGPLGMFVELQDMYYRDVLHSYLGAQLCTWAVQDQRDRAQLMSILKRAAEQGGYKPANGQRIPNVIFNSGELFDFSGGDLSNFGHTIISKLSVSDPYVLRCLVNSGGIERTFLAPSNHDANLEVDRLQSRAGEHRSLGREIKVLSADKFEHTGRGRAKNVGPIPDWRGPPLFTRNLAADIEEMRARAAEKRSIEAHHKQEHRALVERRDALKSEIYRERDALAKLNRNLPKFDAQIEDLKERLAQNPSDEIGGLQSYKREELNKKAAIEAQYMALEQTINTTIMPDLERLKEEAEEAKRKHEDYTPALMRKRDALTEIAKLRDKERGVTKHWASRKIRYEDEQRVDRAAVERHEKELEEWISKAKQFHAERINTRRTIEELTNEREAVNQSVARAEQQAGFNIEDLVLTKEKLEKEIRELRETSSSLSEVVQIGKLAIGTRKKWWGMERGRLAFGVRSEFVVNCGKRNMVGRLTLDHSRALGEIRVRTVGNAAEGGSGGGDDHHYKTIKSLSGGEKSFVTVSLLLSLWQVVTGPIKCLDEWDVFLDDVNRAVAARMLLEGAKEQSKQFVLITPQSMSNAAQHIGAEDKIIKMADPIRNQGTLDISAR